MTAGPVSPGSHVTHESRLVQRPKAAPGSSGGRRPPPGGDPGDDPGNEKS